MVELRVGDTLIGRYVLKKSLRQVQGLSAWVATDQALSHDCQLMLITDPQTAAAASELAGSLALSKSRYFTPIEQIRTAQSVALLVTGFDAGVSALRYVLRAQASNTRPFSFEAVRSIIGETLRAVEELRRRGFNFATISPATIRISKQGITLADAPLSSILSPLAGGPFSDELVAANKPLLDMDSEGYLIRQLAATLYMLLSGDSYRPDQHYDASQLQQLAMHSDNFDEAIQPVPDEFQILCERGLAIRRSDGTLPVPMSTLMEFEALLGDWKPIAELSEQDIALTDEHRMQSIELVDFITRFETHNQQGSASTSLELPDIFTPVHQQEKPAETKGSEWTRSQLFSTRYEVQGATLEDFEQYPADQYGYNQDSRRFTGKPANSLHTPYTPDANVTGIAVAGAASIAASAIAGSSRDLGGSNTDSAFNTSAGNRLADENANTDFAFPTIAHNDTMPTIGVDVSSIRHPEDTRTESTTSTTKSIESSISNSSAVDSSIRDSAVEHSTNSSTLTDSAVGTSPAYSAEHTHSTDQTTYTDVADVNSGDNGISGANTTETHSVGADNTSTGTTVVRNMQSTRTQAASASEEVNSHIHSDDNLAETAVIQADFGRVSRETPSSNSSTTEQTAIINELSDISDTSDDSRITHTDNHIIKRPPYELSELESEFGQESANELSAEERSLAAVQDLGRLAKGGTSSFSSVAQGTPIRALDPEELDEDEHARTQNIVPFKEGMTVAEYAEQVRKAEQSRRLAEEADALRVQEEAEELAQRPAAKRWQNRIIAVVVALAVIMAIGVGVAASLGLFKDQSSDDTTQSSSKWPTFNSADVPFPTDNGDESATGSGNTSHDAQSKTQSESSSNQQSSESASSTKKNTQKQSSSTSEGTTSDQKKSASNKKAEANTGTSTVSKKDKNVSAVPAPKQINTVAYPTARQTFINRPSDLQGRGWYIQLTDPHDVSRVVISLRQSGGQGAIYANATPNNPTAGEKVADFSFDQSGTTDIKLNKTVNTKDLVIWVPVDSTPTSASGAAGLYFNSVTVY